MKALGIIFFISSIYYIFGYLITRQLGILLYLVPIICAGTILTVLSMEKPTKLWFRAKRYGYGWTPATWQGWLITLVFALLIGLVGVITKREHSISDVLSSLFPFEALLVATLLGICIKTGEKPRWRWGK